MAKSRMAGDALREKREKARERIGNDPESLAERLSIVDRDAYDFSGYSDKDINMALQGGTFGDEDYARLTGQSLDKPKTDGQIDAGSETAMGGGVGNVGGDVTVNNNEGMAQDNLAAILAGLMDKGAVKKQQADAERDVNLVQTFDRTFGDNQNTMGNQNVIYGNFNQGNIDRSLNN